MAAPIPSRKVKDKEYTNWLKVTLALYYMKSGLHTFIQSEVDCLHQSLIHKIYGGQIVPLPPCTMCHANHLKRNKFTGVWAFPKQCRSYCGVWLDELLVLHTSPKSDKIYWNNSDVPSWPFKPWECAKVFMPRGQQPSNAGPSDCDAQALLTLLASCTHFHPKLSLQGLGLTHTISTIRNNIIHNGEMKVSDVDRMSFIQQILQLLEDPVSLVSLEDCKAAVTNIHKINNDSVDVFFNVDLEMTALRASVNELSQELGLERTRTLDTVDLLKDEFRKLREQLTQRLEDIVTRMDTIERDVKSIQEQTDTVLQQQENHQEMSASTISQQAERIGNVETRIDTIERDVKSAQEQTDTVLQQQDSKLTHMSTNVTSHGIRLDTVKENVDYIYIRMDTIEKDVQSVMEHTDTALQQQEKKHQQSMETASASIVKHGIRLDTVEENVVKLQEEIGQMSRVNNSCVKALTERRPESDGLRRLKNQSEDNIDTFRKMGFVRTTQTEEAEKLLQKKRSVFIKGNPGEGKTSTALHLIDTDDYINQRVVVKSPKDWKKVDTDWVKIVVVEDIFGQYDLDHGRLHEWIDDYLAIIQKHVDVGKLQVIITSRNDVFLKAYSKLKSFKLFSDSLSMTLSSEKLTNSDKKRILNEGLQRNEKTLNDDEIEKCITNFSGLMGFPQCCSLFAGDNDLFNQGSKIFKSPEKFLVDNITNLNVNSVLSLAFLFCNGEIEEEYLSPSQKESEKYLPVLEDLTSYLNISFNKSAMVSLRESYDHFSGLYIQKVFLYEPRFGGNVKKSCIKFSHATIYEAVGQVLGDKCPEMIVKYCDSGYLYQRTYIAGAKDNTSQNVFLPVSVYRLLAKRIINDVVEKKLVKSVVKHSAFKQDQFLMELKDELRKVKRIRNFFLDYQHSWSISSQDLSEGGCLTFMQNILKSDGDVVRLVYNEFLEFLECAHNNNIPGCWQCEEKQKLLELALYYQHFEISDKLITKSANYTCVSLCNAARHGDLRRVQTILETLKESQDFNPECFEAKESLYRAFISGNQGLIDLLLKEEITLDSKHVVDVVTHGDVNALKKVVEHLKCCDNWNPHLQQYRLHAFYTHRIPVFEQYRLCFDIPPEIAELPFTKALCIAYCNEKFEMADYLLKNQVKISMHILASVSKSGSQQAVDRMIQNLKLSGMWDSQCHGASNALAEAFHAQKYDVCGLLIQERVSLTMENLLGAIARHPVSFESIQKVIQHLKDTDSWDPKCDDASEALIIAYRQNIYDICDLLIREGISITMVHIPHVIMRSLDCVKMAVKQLKDTDSWDPKCDNASKALENAYCAPNYDVCDLLTQEGVLLTMNNLCQVIILGSFETATKAIKQLKDTDCWNPNCDEASEALGNAYSQEKYDVCDLLVKEGVSLTMKHLPSVILRSLDDVKKTIQQLKDAKLWDPKCDDATKALVDAYYQQKYDVCDVMIQERVALTMKDLCQVIFRLSHESAVKAFKQLKDTGSWNPKCEVASEALKSAFIQKKYELCDLLIQEGFLLTMKRLPIVVQNFRESFESVSKAIHHLKCANNWDPNCDEASEALANAYCQKKYDVCDLMIQEGVSLTMKSFPGVVGNLMVSWQCVKKAIKHLKDTESWDPKCDDASKALENAYKQQKYDVCDLLIQEGILLIMKHLPGVIWRSHDHVKKALKQLKDTNSWDPKCQDASNALAIAYSVHKYTICNLLIQEGVSLTMKSLLFVIRLGSLESARKSIQQLKDTGCWDPNCVDASEALNEASRKCYGDVFLLLVSEGVKLTMRHLPAMSVRFLDYVKTVVKQLKDTERWDPTCDDAAKALALAYSYDRCNMCDFLIQEGVTLTMKNLPCVLSGDLVSLESVKKAVQHLKHTNQWISSSFYAEEVLVYTKSKGRKDICEFFINEGVCYPELNR